MEKDVTPQEFVEFVRGRIEGKHPKRHSITNFEVAALLNFIEGASPFVLKQIVTDPENQPNQFGVECRERFTKAKCRLKHYRLKQDIVIPTGTVFEQRFGTTDYGSGTMYQEIFGLTKDTSGTVTYGIDESDPRVEEWFEEIEQ